MKILELSKITGFGVSTIYDYLRIGLLHTPQSHTPTKSYFDNSHVDRLNLIRKLKSEEKLSKDQIIKKLNHGKVSLVNLKNLPGDIKILIIDKALELFSENGYEHTRISDITDSLNIGSGTFYRFFNSKEELLFGCMDRLPKVLIPKQAWAKVRQEKDYIKRLRNRGHAMMNAFPSYIGILNHIRLLLGNENKDIANKAAECLQNVVKPLKSELSYAVKQGTIRDVDEDLIPFVLLGINSICGDRMLVDSKYTVDEAFSVVEDFVYHALVNHDTLFKDKWERVTLELMTGDSIIINDLYFNNIKNIEGSFKSGNLSFNINDIKSISVLDISEEIELRIKDINAMVFLIKCDLNTVVTGKINNAHYDVSLSKVKQIYFA